MATINSTHLYETHKELQYRFLADLVAAYTLAKKLILV